MLKRTDVIGVREMYQSGKLARDSRTFLRFFEGDFYTKSLTESERSDRF